MLFSKLTFYLIVYPLSRLPLPVLYVFTDFLYLIVYYGIGYRKQVVMQNLMRSFPHKSKQELNAIAKRFYRHFTDLLAEGVKNLSISESELTKRITVQNPELMEELFRQQKSVLLVSGHYNNWEFVITAQHSLFPHQAVGIGKALTNKFWDNKINQLRARMGMRILNHRNTMQKLREWQDETLSILALSDQSPGDSLKSYWTTFLNQPTAVLFGTETMANEFDMPVVFFHLEKTKRGYYQMVLDLITDKPRDEKYGFITEAHTQKLEAIIIQKPEFWLWSHKRWKREIPENLDELKSNQQARFEQKYRQN